MGRRSPWRLDAQILVEEMLSDMEGTCVHQSIAFCFLLFQYNYPQERFITLARFMRFSDGYAWKIMEVRVHKSLSSQKGVPFLCCIPTRSLAKHVAPEPTHFVQASDASRTAQPCSCTAMLQRFRGGTRSLWETADSRACAE